jgi:hypothetical protein
MVKNVAPPWRKRAARKRRAHFATCGLVNARAAQKIARGVAIFAVALTRPYPPPAHSRAHHVA